MQLGDVILIVLASLAVIPVGVLAIETLVALLPARTRKSQTDQPRPRCAILIPAHNEQVGIASTIAHLRPELREGDRIIVIADNCSDHTAEIAREQSVEAIERQDTERRGKGFAL